MTARSVSTLSVFAALLIGGNVLAQSPPQRTPPGYTAKPNYDASRRTAHEAVPMFTVPQPRHVRVPPADSGTVSLKQLLHETPGKAMKEWDRAEKAREKGDSEKAMAHLRKAIEIDPEFVAARNNLAALLILTETPEKAVEQLEESVRLDPHNPLPTANLAVAYTTLRQFEPAERVARRAVDLDRTGARARMILGLVLVMRDQFTDEALKLLRRAQEDFPQADLLTARVYAARGDREQAEAAIERYLASGDQSGLHIAQEWSRLLKSAAPGAPVASQNDVAVR